MMVMVVTGSTAVMYCQKASRHFAMVFVPAKPLISRGPLGCAEGNPFTTTEKQGAPHLQSRGLDNHLPRSGLSHATLYNSRMVLQTPSYPSPTELSEADAPEVAGLYDRCADYFLLQDGMPPTLADANELFTDVPPEKGARDQTVLGWRGDDGLYAIGAILRDYPRDGTWYLGFMIVDAARRNMGLGRSIYGAIEDWAATRGATEIRLAVLEVNGAGERFWRSLGFDEVRRVGPDAFKIKSHRRIELSRHLNRSFVMRGN